MNTQRIDTLYDLKYHYTGHFFSPDSMRFFNSRVLPTIYHKENSDIVAFITSEKFDWKTPRYYTIRLFDPANKSQIDNLGEFQAYKTRYHAVKALKIEGYK